MTGPYHTICSLYEILKKHNELKESVKRNKKRFCEIYKNFLKVPDINQPLICTYTTCKITSNFRKVVLYNSRDLDIGSIVCHLGEVHLGMKSKAEILKYLDKIN